jgi:hypothetical protein
VAFQPRIVERDGTADVAAPSAPAPRVSRYAAERRKK